MMETEKMSMTALLKEESSLSEQVDKLSIRLDSVKNEIINRKSGGKKAMYYYLKPGDEIKEGDEMYDRYDCDDDSDWFKANVSVGCTYNEAFKGVTIRRRL